MKRFVFLALLMMCSGCGYNIERGDGPIRKTYFVPGLVKSEAETKADELYAADVKAYEEEKKALTAEYKKREAAEKKEKAAQYAKLKKEFDKEMADTSCSKDKWDRYEFGEYFHRLSSQYKVSSAYDVVLGDSYTRRNVPSSLWNEMFGNYTKYLHENDLTGYLLENSDVWTHVKMPQIAIEDEVWDIGHKVFKRAKGTILNKGQMSMETLLEMKNGLGTYVWQGQYQQEPCPPEGGIIKEAWLHFFNERDFSRLQPYQLFISWDTGNKTGVDNAYSACCVILMTRDYKFYLLEVVRGKWTMPELVDKVQEVYNRWKYDKEAGNYVKMLIEDKASGTQLIQILSQLADARRYQYEVEAVRPNEDKVSRLMGASAFIEAGHVFFPQKELPWWPDFKKELLSFPGCKFKDQVDAFTQAITFPQKEGI